MSAWFNLIAPCSTGIKFQNINIGNPIKARSEVEFEKNIGRKNRRENIQNQNAILKTWPDFAGLRVMYIQV